MPKVTPEVLATCLDDVEAGRLSPEQCAAAHPAEAEELRQLLEIARAIPAPPSLAPDPAFRMRARVALVEAMAANQTPPAPLPFLRPWWQGHPGLQWVPALALAFALVLATTGAGAVYAAQDAIPGDPLYPVKLTMEDLQVALAPDDDGLATLYVTLAARRVDEVEKAVESARPEAAAEASRSFLKTVEQADRHLARAAAASKPVAGLEARLSEHLGRMQQRLAGAEAGAAPEARSPIAAAAQAAGAGLGSKKAGAPGRGPGQKGQSAFEGNGGLDLADAGAAAADLEGLKTEIERLAAKEEAPGQSFQGLMSHLRAAEAALGRGQPQVAARNLEAFLNQLNAFRQAGHISPAGYDALHQAYQALAVSLQEAPARQQPPASPGRPASAGGAGRPPTPPGRP